MKYKHKGGNYYPLLFDRWEVSDTTTQIYRRYSRYEVVREIPLILREVEVTELIVLPAVNSKVAPIFNKSYTYITNVLSYTRASFGEPYGGVLELRLNIHSGIYITQEQLIVV